MRTRHTLVVVALLATVLSAPPAWAQAANTPGLKVGASKVDITPAPNELPPTYEGVNDPIYSRAIVIDNGEDRRRADHGRRRRHV